MGITDDVWLPSDEELTVQEIPLSGPALKAGAFHMGKACEFENNVRLFYYLINLYSVIFCRNLFCVEKKRTILDDV